MKFIHGIGSMRVFGLLVALTTAASGLSIELPVRSSALSLPSSSPSSSASFLAAAARGRAEPSGKKEEKEEKESSKQEEKKEESSEEKEEKIEPAAAPAPAAMARLEASLAPGPQPKLGAGLRVGRNSASLQAGAPAPAAAAEKPKPTEENETEELEAVSKNETNSTEAMMEAAAGSDPNVDGEVASVNIKFELRNIDYTLLDKPRSVNPLLTATSLLLSQRKPHFETIVQDGKMEISRVASEPTNREVLEKAVKDAVLEVLGKKLNQTTSSSIEQNETGTEVLTSSPSPAPSPLEGKQPDEPKEPKEPPKEKKEEKSVEKKEEEKPDADKDEDKATDEDVSLLQQAPAAEDDDDGPAAPISATQAVGLLKPETVKKQQEADEKSASEDSLASLKKTKEEGGDGEKASEAIKEGNGEEEEKGDKDSLEALKKTKGKENKDEEEKSDSGGGAPAPAAAALAPSPAAISRIQSPLAPSPAPPRPAPKSDLTVPGKEEEKVTEVQAVSDVEAESKIPIVNVHFEPGKPQGKALSISLIQREASALGSFSTMAKVHIIDRPGTGSSIMSDYEDIVRTAIEDGTLETMLESSVSTVTKDDTVVGTIYEDTGSIKPYNAQRCAQHLKTLIERFSAAYTRARVPEALYHACSNFNQKESFSDDAIVDHLDKRRCQDATKRFVTLWEYGRGQVDYDRYCLELCELKHGDDAINCDAYKYIALGA